MRLNQNNYNNRGEIRSYELYDVLDLSSTSPFPHEYSKIPAYYFESAYRSFVGKYPFKPEYINSINPYTKKKVETKEDYYQYLREHCYYSICDSFFTSEKSKIDTFARDANEKRDLAQKRADGLEQELAQAEKENAELRDKLDSLKWKLEWERNDRKKGRRAFLILLAVVIALASFLGVRAKNNAFSAGEKAGQESGYAAGIADQQAADEKEIAKSYAAGEKDGRASGYQTGYSEGEAAGYSEGRSDGYSDGYSDGKETGYQSGYSAGKKDANNSGSSSSWNRTNPGTTRDEPTTDSYIGNKNSKKFHLPTCSYLPDIGNRVYFDTRDDALAAGYDPCGHCHP